MDSSNNVRELLIRLGYREHGLQEILDELNKLCMEIEFDKIIETATTAIENKDTPGFTGMLELLMSSLEDRGVYRPDFPPLLLKQLVNGLNFKNEDIFYAIDRSNIPAVNKKYEKEFLVSCAASTQLGYILLSCIVPDVRAVSAGPHVFTIADGFSPGSAFFIDFSLESIKLIDVKRMYVKKGDTCYLKSREHIQELDSETSGMLSKYYSFFQVTGGIGLGHIIHNNLGLAYDAINRYDDAVEEFREAIKLNPEYIEARNNLAVQLTCRGEHAAAIEELQKVLEFNPGYTESRCNLGQVYASMERYDDATAEFKETLRLDPGYAPGHNGLGNVYARQNKYSEAEVELQEAVRLDPGYAPAYSSLGLMYLEQENNGAAAAELEKAVGLNPELVEAQHGLALAYYLTKKYDRASRAWVKAVHLSPELMDSVPDELKLKVTRGVSRLRESD